MTQSVDPLFHSPQIVVRASSLPGLFSCPACWEAKHIRKIWMPESASARMGTAIHAGTAAYDSAELGGTPIHIDEAVDAAISALWEKRELVAWEDDLGPNDAEPIVRKLVELYCTAIAPKRTYIAVELTCNRLDLTDLGISLTGTIDRIRDTGFGYGITDLKTGKQAVSSDGVCKTQGHGAQLAVYELLAQVSFGVEMTEPAQVVGLQVAKTPKGQRVATGEISGLRSILLDSEFDEPGLLTMAARLIHSGTFFGNPKSQFCGEKYCPIFNTCKWRK